LGLNASNYAFSDPLSFKYTNLNHPAFLKMTKKNSLLAALALLSLCSLYAFAYPEAVRENVFKIFFPEGERPVALTFDSPESEVADPEPVIEELEPATLDTFPPLSER